MKKFLYFLVFTSIVSYASYLQYLQYSKMNEWQSYQNVKYDYGLKFPPDWEMLALNDATSTATTIYFYPSSDAVLKSQTVIPPQNISYVFVNVVPNLEHFQAPDWFQKQIKYSLSNPPQGTTIENDTVYGREALRVTEKNSNGEVLTDNFLVDYEDSIINIGLHVYRRDAVIPPDSIFSGMIHSISLKK